MSIAARNTASIGFLLGRLIRRPWPNYIDLLHFYIPRGSAFVAVIVSNIMPRPNPIEANRACSQDGLCSPDSQLSPPSYFQSCIRGVLVET